MTSQPGNPELIVTILALTAGVILAGSMVWLEKRPRNDFSPKLVPTTPVMFLGVFIALLALVHLLNLFGVTTGRQ